jgi:hypothetical protein
MRILLPAGPALLLAGIVLMAVPDAWTVSHLVFLAGTLLMLPVAAALPAYTGPVLGRVAQVLTSAGALALAGQFLLDLAVDQLVDDAAARGPLFDRLQESPAIFLVLYAAGPALLFVGLAVSGAGTAGRHPVPGGLLIAGTLLAGLARIVDQRPVEIAAGALILVALALLARAGRPQPVPVP